MALVISPCLPGLPEPVRAGLDHCLARACDALESGKLLTFFRERFKPTLDFQAVTEARTITVVNVVADALFRWCRRSIWENCTTAEVVMGGCKGAAGKGGSAWGDRAPSGSQIWAVRSGRR